MRTSEAPRWVKAGASGLVGAIAALLLAPVPVAMARGAGQEGRDDSSNIVSIDTGLIRGVHSGEVDSFLGIPYAQPPVGDLRWKPPQPAKPWTGIRDTVAYGNRCPAPASTNGPRSETEDCLFINVQRPAGTHSDDRLPVYFFIHGGANANGSSNQHDGTFIIQNSGIIIVTINYRLGVFGFLAHPSLTRESGESGNYGFMDQQSALGWVHRNIAAFGGDPRRVTIGGESSGGLSVCGHLSAPGSQGLFARATVESGTCATRTLGEAEAQGASIAQSLGCATDTTAAQCLRGQSASRLVDVTPTNPILLVRGVPVLPQDPDVAIRTGNFARVPILFGSNHDEGRTFTQGFIGQTKEQYVAFVRGLFGSRADAVLALYPWPANADAFTPAYLVGAIFTDSGFLLGIGGCGTRSLTQALAKYTQTFSYEFDHPTGPGLNPKPAGYQWGAGHAAELAYLWPSFNNGVPIAPTFNAGERILATNMAEYWSSFVSSGRPKAEQSSPWRRYDETRLLLSLRANGESKLISNGDFAADHKCAFWDAQPK
jgi:carboxylesterase type B